MTSFWPHPFGPCVESSVCNENAAGGFLHPGNARPADLAGVRRIPESGTTRISLQIRAHRCIKMRVVRGFRRGRAQLRGCEQALCGKEPPAGAEKSGTTRISLHTSRSGCIKMRVVRGLARGRPLLWSQHPMPQRSRGSRIGANRSIALLVTFLVAAQSSCRFVPFSHPALEP